MTPIEEYKCDRFRLHPQEAHTSVTIRLRKNPMQCYSKCGAQTSAGTHTDTQFKPINKLNSEMESAYFINLTLL